MKERIKFILIISIIASCFVTNVSAISYKIPTDKQLWNDSDAVVSVKILYFKIGKLSTIYTATVNKSFKGETDKTIQIEIPGSPSPIKDHRFYFGMTHPSIDDELLIFLNKKKFFVPTHDSLGIFHTQEIKGQKLLIRVHQPDIKLDNDNNSFLLPRHLTKFQSWLIAMSIGQQYDESYFLKPIDIPSEKWSYIGNSPIRWDKFDNNQSVTWDIDDTSSIPSLNTAMSTWNTPNTPTNINLQYQFGSPSIITTSGSGSLPNVCNSTGGVLGRASVIPSGTHMFQGLEYQTIGTVSMQIADGLKQCEPELFIKTLQHELGHTLGLGHSCDVDSCIAGTTEGDAMMAAVNNGSELNSDDLSGVQFIYGSSTTTQSPESLPYISFPSDCSTSGDEFPLGPIVRFVTMRPGCTTYTREALWAYRYEIQFDYLSSNVNPFDSLQVISKTTFRNPDPTPINMYENHGTVGSGYDSSIISKIVEDSRKWYFFVRSSNTQLDAQIHVNIEVLDDLGDSIETASPIGQKLQSTSCNSSYGCRSDFGYFMPPRAVDTDIRAHTNFPGDIDYMAFYHTANSDVIITAKPWASSYINVIDHTGNRPQSQRLNGFVTYYLPNVNNTYYSVFANPPGITGPAGAVDFRMIRRHTDDEPNFPSNAKTVQINTPVNASLGVDADIDWFEVRVPTDGFFSVFSTGDVDTLGTLWKDDGTLVSKDNDTGANNNFLIYTYLSAGTYWISVNGFDMKSRGLYTLHTELNSNANQPPVPVIDFSCNELVCTFDATSSIDPDGEVIGFHWDFGDNNESSEAISEYSYGVSGEYTVRLTITDNSGSSTSIEEVINIVVHTNPPVIELQYGCGGQRCWFDIRESYDPDGGIYDWEIDFGDGDSKIMSGNTVRSYGLFQHDYHDLGQYSVNITAIDNLGARTTKIVEVQTEASIKWSYFDGAGGTISNLVVSSSGMSIIRTDNVIHAINSDGTLAWKKDAIGAAGNLILTNSGLIIPGNINNSIIAYDMNGNLAWEYMPEGRYTLNHPILQTKDNLILITYNVFVSQGVEKSFIDAITKDGVLKWRTEVPLISKYNSSKISGEGIIFSIGNLQSDSRGDKKTHNATRISSSGEILGSTLLKGEPNNSNFPSLDNGVITRWRNQNGASQLMYIDNNGTESYILTCTSYPIVLSEQYWINPCTSDHRNHRIIENGLISSYNFQIDADPFHIFPILYGELGHWIVLDNGNILGRGFKKLKDWTSGVANTQRVIYEYDLNNGIITDFSVPAFYRDNPEVDLLHYAMEQDLNTHVLQPDGTYIFVQKSFIRDPVTTQLSVPIFRVIALQTDFRPSKTSPWPMPRRDMFGSFSPTINESRFVDKIYVNSFE